MAAIEQLASCEPEKLIFYLPYKDDVRIPFTVKTQVGRNVEVTVTTSQRKLFKIRKESTKKNVREYALRVKCYEQDVSQLLVDLEFFLIIKYRCLSNGNHGKILIPIIFRNDELVAQVHDDPKDDKNIQICGGVGNINRPKINNQNLNIKNFIMLQLTSPHRPRQQQTNRFKPDLKQGRQYDSKKDDGISISPQIVDNLKQHQIHVFEEAVKPMPVGKFYRKKSSVKYKEKCQEVYNTLKNERKTKKRDKKLRHLKQILDNPNNLNPYETYLAYGFLLYGLNFWPMPCQRFIRLVQFTE
ncbi:unnamed protein product [Bursaphelenchus okinawaensis]|uniref:Uncharacterized protein n=1 Tax=Bursaphelenchus okinawaensis TaxID=465554 RepID=A0A811L6L7_9BILA|nr:unnamed protein product [Bursaphelenchus okinawaensis]CAG9116787.1 unnamed protein product [Bursaphelenchus okinawaensis]